MKHHAYETPKKDLMNRALNHYKEASDAIHHWNSDIPKAIEHYYLNNKKLNKIGWISVGITIGLLLGTLLCKILM